MKTIVSTSNKYLHLIPVFTYLFNKYWDSSQQVEIVGYDAPKCDLPANFTFHSMGEQGPVNEWSTDLRKYFESQDDWFIWLMEDTFIKSFDEGKMWFAYAMMMPEVGRIGLTKDIVNRPHDLDNGVAWARRGTMYRQSTQPSIWNKQFLLKYLVDGLTPWEFELQQTNDDFHVCGLVDYPVRNNEGVRKHNVNELDLNGFSQEDILHIKTLL